MVACENDGAKSSSLHTIAFAGDTILARTVNSLVHKYGFERPLKDVKRELSTADLSLVNLECVLASQGTPCCIKTGSVPYLRGRPEMVRVLSAAGVDLVTLANNHAGDYGPDGLKESLEILRQAGIEPLGAGNDVGKARAPVYRRLGEVVVAFIGVHTDRGKSAAKRNRGGTNYIGGKDLDRTVKLAAKQVKHARKYADLVFLVIHWGPNNRIRPVARNRTLAKRFVREADVDAVLGSSAHMLQGIEVIDGRPIIYDAGNLILDWPKDRSWSHKSAIFVLHVDQSGVKKIEIKPTSLFHGYVKMADQPLANEILKHMKQLSQEFGTQLTIESKIGVIDIERSDPVPIPSNDYDDIESESVSPRLPTIDSYMPPVVVEKLPRSAKRLNVQFENGMTLLGHEMPDKVQMGLGLNLTTYWMSKEKLNNSYEILTALYADLETKKKTTKRLWRLEKHQPGDWMYPTTRWQPNQIVRDYFHLRQKRMLEGPLTYEVKLALMSGTERVRVLDDSQHDGMNAVSVGAIVIE